MPGKVTLAQAETARDQHATELARRGAHAVGVEKTADGWCVTAYVTLAEPFVAPTRLLATIAGKDVHVPLKVLRNEVAKPE